jgi:hypothetical protein
MICYKKDPHTGEKKIVPCDDLLSTWWVVGFLAVVGFLSTIIILITEG